MSICPHELQGHFETLFLQRRILEQRSFQESHAISIPRRWLRQLLRKDICEVSQTRPCQFLFSRHVEPLRRFNHLLWTLSLSIWHDAPLGTVSQLMIHKIVDTWIAHMLVTSRRFVFLQRVSQFQAWIPIWCFLLYVVSIREINDTTFVVDSLIITWFRREVKYARPVYDAYYWESYDVDVSISEAKRRIIAQLQTSSWCVSDVPDPTQKLCVVRKRSGASLFQLL